MVLVDDSPFWLFGLVGIVVFALSCAIPAFIAYKLLEHFAPQRPFARKIVAVGICLLVLIGWISVLVWSFLDVNIETHSPSQNVISEMIRNIESKGAGVELKSPVFFDPGTLQVFYLVQGTPVNQSAIVLHCEDPAGSGATCDTGSNGNSPIHVDYATRSITIERKVTAAVSVCKGFRSSTYHICLGSRELATDLETKCLTHCAS